MASRPPIGLIAAAAVAVGTGLIALAGTPPVPATRVPRAASTANADAALPVPAACLSAALCANVFYQGEATAYADRALVALLRREWRAAAARVGQALAPRPAERLPASAAAARAVPAPVFANAR
jgi:hypothetical protein